MYLQKKKQKNKKKVFDVFNIKFFEIITSVIAVVKIVFSTKNYVHTDTRIKAPIITPLVFLGRN